MRLSRIPSRVMSESDPPESSDPAPPGHGRESRRRRLEGVIPEIIKRAVEIGVEKARESPDNVKQFVADLKVPKEIAHYLLQQIDETKNGLLRVVAKEIRDFLEHANLTHEVQSLLTKVQFEVNTTIRFAPNVGPTPRDAAESSDGSISEGEAKVKSKPEVETSVHIRREDRGRRAGGAR